MIFFGGGQVPQVFKIVLNLILPSIVLGNFSSFRWGADLIAHYFIKLMKIWNDTMFKTEVQERPHFVHPST